MRGGDDEYTGREIGPATASRGEMDGSDACECPDEQRLNALQLPHVSQALLETAEGFDISLLVFVAICVDALGIFSLERSLRDFFSLLRRLVQHGLSLWFSPGSVEGISGGFEVDGFRRRLPPD